jgi:hypothetical protein
MREGGHNTLCLEPNSMANRVKQDVVIVTSRLPGRESAQTSVLDELAFGSERPFIVVRNHHIHGWVVQVRLRDAFSLGQTNSRGIYPLSANTYQTSNPHPSLPFLHYSTILP